MRFQCPHCQGIVAIDDSEMGEAVGCGHCGEITVVPKTRFSSGVMINDFIIRDTLGHGGMGTVFLAHQYSLDRAVALKILMEQFSRNSEFIVDFVKEARAAARLNHPNIVQSFAVGEEDGIYFFAMEYVEGKTLKQMLETEGAIPVPRALNIVLQVAEALDFAWKNQQLVHRDIKPDNIMLTHRGVAKLADLGLARMAHETIEDDEDLVMGTPQYICPEQLLGQPMDVRGDIYSLGATLYHAVTGEFPFDGRTASEIARKHLQEPCPDPRSVKPDVPATVVFLIHKMMAKKIEDRYGDAQELAMDISLILRGENPVGFGKEPAGSASPSRRPGSAGNLAGGRRSSAGKGRTPAASAQSNAPAGGQAGGLITASQTSTRMPVMDESTSAPPPAAAPANAAPEDDAEENDANGATTLADGDESEIEGDGDETEGGADAGSQTVGGSSRPGGKRIKIGKKKSKLSTGGGSPSSTRVMTPGTATGMSAAGRASAIKGVAPESTTKPGRMLLYAVIGVVALVIVVALIMVSVFVVRAKPWGVKTSQEAEALYFSRPGITAGERTDYLALKSFAGQAEIHKSNEEVLRKAAADAASFQKKYPNSIFVQPDANAIDYKALLSAPYNLYAEKATPEMKKLVGTVNVILVNYNAVLIAKLREDALEKRQDEVNSRIADVKSDETEQHALEEVAAAVSTRQLDLQRAQKEFAQITPNRKAVLEKQKDATRKAVIALCQQQKFIDAFFLVEKARADVTGYPQELATLVPAFLKQDLESAGQVLPAIIAKYRLANSTKLGRRKNEKEGELEIDKWRNDIESLINADKAVIAGRDEWFVNFQQMVGFARDYHELVANSQRKLAERKIDKLRVPNLRPGEKLDVSMITPESVTVQVYTWDPGTGKKVLQRTEIVKLEDVPRDVFMDLAKAAWGDHDLAGYNLRLGAWTAFASNYFVAKNFPEAHAAIEASGADQATFIGEELTALEPLLVQYLVDSGVEAMKKIAATGNKVKVNQSYQFLRTQLGTYDAFRARDSEMLGIYESVPTP